jgi:AraC family transcriptional regulator
MKKSARRRPLKKKRAWLRLAREAKFNAADMAALCGITLRQLERHAQQVFGCPPQQWLDEQRMIAADVLLRETDTIKEVAIQLGYSQASHFCRQFKQYFGFTPSQFIKQCRRLDRSD